jgi:hypothetical protein
MSNSRKKKYLLLGSLCLVLVFGAILLWRTYGPGCKALTSRGIEWERSELDDGLTVEFSTTFFVGDTSDLSNYFFVAPGAQVVQVLLNHQIIMDLHPYAYYPQNLDSMNFDIRKIYEVHPHYIGDYKVRSAIREGYNSLRVWITKKNLEEYGSEDWKLGAYCDQFSFRYKNERKWEGHVRETQETIPILYLYVPDHVIPDDPKVRGTSKLMAGKEVLFEEDVLLEARGRSSQAFSKKQFNMRVVEKGGKSRKDIAIGQMPPAADWILYGPYIDLSQIRNSIAYSLFQDMGHYAPRFIPIELMINNNYRGLYYLMEKVQAIPGRVDIRFDPQDSMDVANNAFLVQVNPASENDLILYPSHTSFIMEDPQPGYEPSNWYIKRTTDQLSIITRAIDDQIPNLNEAIDFQSFADFIILNELAKNIDAYRLSTFLHKTYEKDDPRIFAGPVWDFNLAFGCSKEENGTIPEGWIFSNTAIVDEMWLNLFNHPAFNSFLQSRYKTLRKGLLSEKSIHQRIDSLVQSIQPVLKYNEMRYGWPESNFWPYEQIPSDHAEEISRIKDFLSVRMQWMDAQLNE